MTPLQFPISKNGNAVDTVATTYTVSALGNTGELVVGINNIVRIVPGAAAVNVRFGSLGTNTATVNDHYIPANTITIWDMGRNTSLCIFSTAGGSVNVGVLSRT